MSSTDSSLSVTPWKETWLARSAAKLGGLTLGYLVFAWIIVGLEWLGSALGFAGLGIVGLAIDVMILAAAVVWLTLKRHPWATSFGPLLGVLVVFLAFAIGDWALMGLRSGFWSLDNVQMIATQSTMVAVAALGMTIIIIAGGIDLSAGTAIALCSVVLAWVLNQSRLVGAGESAYAWPGMWLALPAAILTGVACGFINGALVSALRVVPFIITLGTMTVFLGLAKLLGGSSNIRPAPQVIPDWVAPMVAPQPELAWLAYPVLPNFAWGVWFTMGLAVVTWFILHWTVFGRHVYALGSSESTARLCGVHIGFTKTCVYALGGVLVGLAGLFMFALMSEGEPTGGSGVELKIIAAVVIGGGSLSGGRGSVVGTLTGAAIMPIIWSGCTKLRFPNEIQDIAIGLIIIGAVALDRFRQGRSEGA